MLRTNWRKRITISAVLAAFCMVTLFFATTPVTAAEHSVEVLPPGVVEDGVSADQQLPVSYDFEQLTGEPEEPVAQGGEDENDSILPGQDPAVAVGSIFLNDEERRLSELVNESRSEAGVSGLHLDEKLVELAKLKARDMADNNYLSYTSRTYGTLEDMLKEAGLEYRFVKQKISRISRQVSVDFVHRALMRTETHRNELLDTRYDVMGVAVAGDGQYKYIVEIFAGGGSNLEKPVPQPNPDPQPKPAPIPDPEPEPNPGSGPSAGEKDTGIMSAEERQMLSLVNKERVSRGLQPLAADDTLVKLGRLKAKDMIKKGYFSHTSPTYGSPFDMMRSAGVQYTYAGENLARSWSVDSAHNALMNSSGHRANILNENFNRAGIGIVDDGRYKYFVQLFIRGQGGGSVSRSKPEIEPRPQPQPEPDPEPQPRPDPGSVQGLTASEQQMLSLVNKERTSRGEQALRPNLKLTQVARLKARDMIDKGYFSHTSPTYGSPFEMMRRFGIRYSYAGENLAGAPTVSTAHTNLMNSTGHRRNILNSNFDEVGIGIVNGGPYGKMFVQMFIG